jgi:integrase
VIKSTKFRKSRLVPLHETAEAGINRYLKHRRPYAPYDDHVFVSLQKKPLLSSDVYRTFRTVAKKIGLQRGPDLPHPTPHSFRHTFAVRALESCTGSRDQITKHMVALSTYLGHSKIYHTYWYLEAVPDLMGDIAQRCENFFKGGHP